jgi:hypothetical protein
MDVGPKRGLRPGDQELAGTRQVAVCFAPCSGHQDGPAVRLLGAEAVCKR